MELSSQLTTALGVAETSRYAKLCGANSRVLNLAKVSIDGAKMALIPLLLHSGMRTEDCAVNIENALRDLLCSAFGGTRLACRQILLVETTTPTARPRSSRPSEYFSMIDRTAIPVDPRELPAAMSRIVRQQMDGKLVLDRG